MQTVHPCDNVPALLFSPYPSWKRVEASEDNANQTGITKCVAVDYTNRKETKNSLKRTLYRLLSEYTGVELPWGNLTGIRPTKIPMALLEEGKSEEEKRKK